MVSLLKDQHNYFKLTPSQVKPKICKVRFYLIISFFLLAFIVLGFRLLIITFTKHSVDKLNNSSFAERIVRPDIIDCNGVLLATNLSTASLYANPKDILDPKEAATRLHKILPELNHKHLLEELKSKKSFIWIKRNLVPKTQYAINSLGIPGLYFEQEARRVYTHGPLLSHLIGFVDIDGNGLTGLERYLDNQQKINNPKLADNMLELSVDIRVQNIVTEELSAAMEDFKAIGAVGIISNVHTGEIIAAVSLPNFDPHNPGNTSENQRFNRFSLGLYEPGSTFKTYTIAMALDSGIITLKDLYNVSSPIHIAKFNIKDYHPRQGWLSVPEIFMYSSNIGAAKISADVGKKKQQIFLKNLGLLDSLTELEIPEKSMPLYPNDSRWGELSMMTISYGHGIAVTPLHLVKAMNTMVNGGYIAPLTVLKRNIENMPRKKIMKDSTSKQIRQLLRLVVEEGTGKKARVSGYAVGGKTGTAEKNKHGIYNKNSRLSSFIGAFPMHHPEFSILLMLDEPKGNQSTGGFATAGMVAAPVVARIIERAGPLLGVEVMENDSPDLQNLKLDLYDGELDSF
ncbi:Penicillin-binding protein 2 [Rickettsiales bacterium Ac37b]|nr:Penicillin-binding protein 2 [Rickettsiales bacterium Ac37b]